MPEAKFHRPNTDIMSVSAWGRTPSGPEPTKGSPCFVFTGSKIDLIPLIEIATCTGPKNKISSINPDVLGGGRTPCARNVGESTRLEKTKGSS